MPALRVKVGFGLNLRLASCFVGLSVGIGVLTVRIYAVVPARHSARVKIGVGLK